MSYRNRRLAALGAALTCLLLVVPAGAGLLTINWGPSNPPKPTPTRAAATPTPTITPTRGATRTPTPRPTSTPTVRRTSTPIPRPTSTPTPRQTTSSRLIRPESDLEYLGAFRLPNEQSGGTSWSYGGGGMSYSPNGDRTGPGDGFPGSLFSIGHHAQNFVSEFDIPRPVVSSLRRVEDLPIARTLQSFGDVTAGRQTYGLTGTTLKDVQHIAADGAGDPEKLAWVMYEYYYPEPELSTLGWAGANLAEPNSRGVWHIGPFPSSATSRYLFEIPRPWADTNVGGLSLAAGRSRVVNGGSWGPALYALAPWMDGNPPADQTSLTAVEMLKYDSRNRMRDYSNADQLQDGAWLTVGDKAAVVIAGTKAERPYVPGVKPAEQKPESGQLYYGPAGSHGCGAKGYHGEPYYGALLFYDPSDLGAVVGGSLLPHDPQPYAVFQMENYLFRDGCRKDILGGIGFDRERGLLYVIELAVEGIYQKKPIVHVWRVTDQGSAADVRPPTNPTRLRLNAKTDTTVSMSWDPSSDDFGGVIYLVMRNDEPIALVVDPSFTDATIDSATSYAYTVQARDAVNNKSARSTALVVSATN